MERKPLAGQVALVTGAGRGIGRCVALTLAGQGAKVALAARTVAELDAVKEEIESLGGEAACFPADLSQEAEVVSLVAGTASRWDGLDIVVNNAGIGIFGPLEAMATDAWDRILAINARAPFVVCREAIPHLKQRPHPCIVNISSVVGVKGYANQAAYGASKHAVLGMTKALAKEVQPYGIRVHAISPGGVDTSLVGDARPDLDRSVLIQPQEIADIVLFLVTRRGNAVIDHIEVRRTTSTPWA